MRNACGASSQSKGCFGGFRIDCLVNRWDKCIRLYLESGNVAGEWTSGSIRENVLRGPSTYIWEDEHNLVHSIHQGEGGEQGDAHAFAVLPWAAWALQAVSRLLRSGEKLFACLGDPLMPLLFSLAIHDALEVELEDGELLFAFLDDVYFVCLPRSHHLRFVGCQAVKSGWDQIT